MLELAARLGDGLAEWQVPAKLESTSGAVILRTRHDGGRAEPYAIAPLVPRTVKTAFARQVIVAGRSYLPRLLSIV